jgi:O-antigen/teichoic acid export membrane protein
MTSTPQTSATPSFSQRLQDWLKHNHKLLSNTASLIGTTAITSGLGFLYWWLAARLFSQDDVGLASGAISAMILIATMAILGMGSLLVGELAARPEGSGSAIAAALGMTALVGAGLGLGFIALLPLLSPNLQDFLGAWPVPLLFVAGVIFTTWGNIMDQAVIGLLRGGLQLWRNAIFSIGKLLALLGALLMSSSAVFIFGTWVGGLLVSLVILWLWLLRQGVNCFAPPNWRLLKEARKLAAGHHILNLLLKAPSLLIPMIIITLLSPATNASFYSAWMIASFSFVVPGAMTTALYAVGAANPQALPQKIRFTLRTSYLIGIVSALVIFLSAHALLSLFGPRYAQEAETTLRLLGLGIFPMTIREHYVAVCRIQKRFRTAIRITFLNDLIQISLVIVGALLAGLDGLTLAWLLAMSLEIVFTWPIIQAALRPEGLV